MKKIDISTKKYPGTFALVDDRDFGHLSQYKWRRNRDGYALRSVVGGVVFMHRAVNNTTEGYETDHLNGDKLDNRRSNLKTVTHGRNMWNTKRPNVSYHKSNKRWRARIGVGGKSVFLGWFSSKEAALEAYFIAKARYHA